MINFDKSLYFFLGKESKMENNVEFLPNYQQSVIMPSMDSSNVEEPSSSDSYVDDRRE
jgi:hypothetical protein